MHVQLFPTVLLQQRGIRNQLLIGVDIAHLVLRVGDLLLQIGYFSIQIPVCLKVMIRNKEEIDHKEEERHNI